MEADLGETASLLIRAWALRVREAEIDSDKLT